MKFKDVKYKKVTIELPEDTFKKLNCMKDNFNVFYRDVIDMALCSYYSSCEILNRKR